MALALLLGGCVSTPPSGQEARGAAAGSAVVDGDWPTYGNDPGGTRHSPLAQIDRSNVDRLRVAWTYRTGELADGAWASGRIAFEATPILVDGTLYLSTPFGRVIALDPETGAERWAFDPKVDRSSLFVVITSRGVSSWLDPGAAPGLACRRRIFVGTLDARLIALDAATGSPCQDFGRGGEVSLAEGIAVGRDCRCYFVTSPPAIVNGLVVVGSTIGDNRAVSVERGLVRAYDGRTGALRWTWDPIPTSAADPAAATWAGESWRRNGAANVWSVMSVDHERGLIFAPTSSPSPDFYGGERLGANDYANSVVALRAATGEVVWHFQVVHHDLWDYDVPAQPSLVTVTRDGNRVPAVVVGTKMGHMFVLHRETGAPLFPVEERPVPKSTVPGEEAWPTQPFPVKPRPLGTARLTADDAWGVTLDERNACRERIKSLRYEGIFTPPSLEGTIVFPGLGGGMHWGALSHDPARGLMIAPLTHIPFVVTLVPREQFERERASMPPNVRRQHSPQRGTPYLVRVQLLTSPAGVFCNSPPWGTLAAVDLTSGDVRWEVPLGTIPELWARSVSESRNWGSPNMGGALTTAGGLVFIGAGRDTKLRAFDVETGKVLWEAELPASAQATPMSYRSKSGKQFVVIAAGGHGVMQTKLGDHVVAFALP
ncbi:MAG TPA: pyrroloquinoline quinone-dependent dehydrogenase [Candidatus Acidoferrum sp.]|nr:pyrroloquinoline quinone-dependent dehydrogenase [Candidatus Acidoferrum sp.]